jgi:hypothetical protein
VPTVGEYVRHPERLQSARAVVLGRASRVVEHDLDVPAEQIGGRGRSAAVRHTHHVDHRHHHKQLAGHVGRGPLPEDAMLILPGLALA